MNLRARVLIGNVAIGTLAVFVSGVMAWESAQDLADQNKAGIILAAFHQELKLNGNFGAERGAWGQALQAENAATPDDLAKVQKITAETDGYMQAAIEQSRIAGLSLTALEAAQNALKSLRATSLTALAKAKAERPDNALSANVDSFVTVVNQVNQATNQAYRALGLAAPNLSSAAGLALLAQEMRNVNGMRSSNLGIYARNAPFSPERLNSATEQTGQVALLWKMLQQEVKSQDEPPKLKEAIQHVRSTLMDEGEKRFQSVLQAARAGQPSPEKWGTWTTQTLNNVFVLRDSAIENAQDINGLSRADAKLRLTLSVGVLLTALLLIGAVLRVMSRKVIRPLTDLTKLMTRLAEHDLAVEITGAERADEIGSMAKAMQILRDNSLRADTLAEEQKRDRETREKRAKMLEEMARGFDTEVSGVLDGVTEALTATRAHRRRHERYIPAYHHPSRHGGRRLARGFAQCADGRLGRRGTVRLHRRNRSASGPIQPSVASRRRRGASNQHIGAKPRLDLDPHRRRGQPDQQYRQPDQLAGVERHHRGGAGR
ncbi:HAMP domain-containing protein [Magnetospirillum sp. J10]|uniref:HAMP domain-containing protein n=1 Tax=Magnetospirillum sulfuroxidans TaxID=611300 RepID=A0ABS5ICF9_9PROT|nr:HAMP domain-containing protein [Magnetospirillum sulfuroxidans]